MALSVWNPIFQNAEAGGSWIIVMRSSLPDLVYTGSGQWGLEQIEDKTGLNQFKWGKLLSQVIGDE